MSKDYKYYEKIIKKREDELNRNNKYASEVIDLDYLTNLISKVNPISIDILNNNINRSKSIESIYNVLNDINKSIRIEAGIYEFSLIYVLIEKHINNIVSAIYKDKLNYLIRNIDPNTSTENKTLKNNLINNDIDPQMLAFLDEQSIHPDRWKTLVKKKELKEYKEKNMAATDLYKCYRCGERRCRVIQMQTRSADEPMTNFVTCLECSNSWKC